jgi:hypothetical protein
MDPQSPNEEKKKAETALLDLLKITKEHLIKYALSSSEFEKEDPKARFSPGAQELIMITMQSKLPKQLKRQFGYFVVQADNAKNEQRITHSQQQITQNQQQINQNQQQINRNKKTIARNKKLGEESEARLMKSLGESVMKELANRG